MRDVLNGRDHVVADIEGAELDLGISMQGGMAESTTHSRTHVLLQALNLGQTVVAEVQLLEIDEVLETLEFGDAVALDREDLEVGECAEVLGMSRCKGTEVDTKWAASEEIATEAASQPAGATHIQRPDLVLAQPELSQVHELVEVLDGLGASVYVLMEDWGEGKVKRGRRHVTQE